MGYDLIGYTERRTDCRWELDKEDLYVDRSTVLFDWLFGVSGPNSPCPLLAPLRGLPDDVSERVGYLYDVNDGAFGTWYSVDEILSADLSQEVHGEPLAHYVSGFVEYVKQLKDEGAERLVMWLGC